MFLSVVLVLILAVGYSTFLEAVLPGFLKVSILPIAILLFIASALFSGKHSALEFFRKTLIWTFPLWVFGFARYLIVHSPIMVLLPSDSDTIVLVTAPALVSIGGWLFWRFARYQDVARDAGVLLSLIVHLTTIASVIIDGDMTRTVGMFATASLALTLILVSTVYESSISGYSQKAAIGMSAMALILGVSLLVVHQSTSTKLDKVKSRIESIENRLKSGEIKESARARLKKELESLKSKSGSNEVEVDARPRTSDGQTVPEFVPFTGFEQRRQDFSTRGNMEAIMGKTHDTLQEITKAQNDSYATITATNKQVQTANQIDAQSKPLSRLNQLP